jgi:hypothetical protein
MNVILSWEECPNSCSSNESQSLALDNLIDCKLSLHSLISSLTTSDFDDESFCSDAEWSDSEYCFEVDIESCDPCSSYDSIPNCPERRDSGDLEGKLCRWLFHKGSLSMLEDDRMHVKLDDEKHAVPSIIPRSEAGLHKSFRDSRPVKPMRQKSMDCLLTLDNDFYAISPPCA